VITPSGCWKRSGDFNLIKTKEKAKGLYKSRTHCKGRKEKREGSLTYYRLCGGFIKEWEVRTGTGLSKIISHAGTRSQVVDSASKAKEGLLHRPKEKGSVSPQGVKKNTHVLWVLPKIGGHEKVKQKHARKRIRRRGAKRCEKKESSKHRNSAERKNNIKGGKE